jgi:hypothetical protein
MPLGFRRLGYSLPGFSKGRAEAELKLQYAGATVREALNKRYSLSLTLSRRKRGLIQSFPSASSPEIFPLSSLYLFAGRKKRCLVRL